MDNKVLVTGMGMVSPYGVGVNNFWEHVKAGEYGYSRRETNSNIVGEIIYDSQNKFRYMAYESLTQAVNDAGLLLEGTSKNSLIMASSIGDTYALFNEVSSESADSCNSDSIFIKSLAANLSYDFAVNERCICMAGACASSSLAIKSAYRLIKTGKTDVVYVVGIESCASEIGNACFSALNILSNEILLEKCMLPFDKNGKGFVLSESCGVIVLESEAHAKQRKKIPYCEIIACEANSDAYHIIAPDPEGTGASNVMLSALYSAGLTPNDIDFISAHGTGTRANDDAELKAIVRVFGNTHCMVNSTKSYTGHLLGASGVVETIITVMSIVNSLAIATGNLQNPICIDGITIINSNIHTLIQYAMNNTFAFGGHNVSLILKKMNLIAR